MQGAPWTCQFPGCGSSPEQIASLRSRRPDGFPHDEDPQLRVCTVCRRLSLKGRPAEDDQVEKLDSGFLAGIKEELASIEESETNIQALSQVFRYYAKHARQLSQVLYDFAIKQCFPWELIHAFHLIDDILLMDKTGRYKLELTNRVQAITEHTFRQVQSRQEKREVARMLHAWQELKIFDAAVLAQIRSSIFDGDAAASEILQEAVMVDDEEEECTVQGNATERAAVKKRKVEDNGGGHARTDNHAEVAGQDTAAPKPSLDKVLAIITRIESTPVEQPFEILGIAADNSNGHDIRKAYRRIALLIHPDKNPGWETKCQEALIKLQQGREQAEAELQRRGAYSDGPKVGETRSAATSAAASAAMDASSRCKYPGCDLQPCKQCANGCCTRNITHCHTIARSKAGVQCFFHPPPRAWARNA